MDQSVIGEYEKAVDLAGSFPNLYLDTCAVFESYDILEYFEQHGCARRIVFGTDLPWFSPLHGIGCVLSANISDETRHNILHRNARELLEPLVGAELL